MTINMAMKTNKARKLDEIIKAVKELMLHTNQDKEDRLLLRALTYLCKALRSYNREDIIKWEYSK